MKPAAKAGGKGLAGDAGQDEGMELWGTDSSWAGSLDCAGLLLGDLQAALQVPARGGVVPPEVAAFESITIAVEVRAGYIDAVFPGRWCVMHAWAGMQSATLAPRNSCLQHSLDNKVAAACMQFLLGRLAGMSTCTHQCCLITVTCICMDCVSVQVSKSPLCLVLRQREPRLQVWTLPAALPELSPAEAKAAAAKAKADPMAAAAAHEAALAALPPQQRCKLLPQELAAKLCPLVITPVKVGAHSLASWCDAWPADCWTCLAEPAVLPCCVPGSALQRPQWRCAAHPARFPSALS